MTAGYAALHQRAAWLDLSGRGKLVVRGPDHARLVHALTTNDIQGLMPGQGCYAFLLNAQGKVLADANVFCLDDQILLDTEVETRATVFGHVDSYIIADDATVHDVTDGIATLSLEGPDAVRMLASVDLPVPEAEYGVARSSWGWVACVNSTGQSGFFLFVSRELRAELVQRLENAGAVAATAEEARVVRIENGRPRYGDEITARYLALETAQDHAIHPNKGCYLGQR